jgi:tripeptide aminopeptidase
MLDTVTFAATLAECEAEARVEESYRAYRFRRDDLPVRIATAALARCGVEPLFTRTGGGADANVFNLRGLPCVNLANGMADIHTGDEHIAVDDLGRMVDVTLALVEAAREASEETAGAEGQGGAAAAGSSASSDDPVEAVWPAESRNAAEPNP